MTKRVVRAVLAVLVKHGVRCNAMTPGSKHYQFHVETPSGVKARISTSSTPSDGNWIKAVERDVERLLDKRPPHQP